MKKICTLALSLLLLSTSIVTPVQAQNNKEDISPEKMIQLRRDQIAPKVTFDITKKGTLDIKVTDEHSDVRELVIDNEKTKGFAATHKEVDLKKYSQKEYMYIYAKDYANNRSPIHIIINPYYDGEPTAMIANIEQSQLRPKRNILTSKELPLQKYPLVREIDENGDVHLYYVIYHPRELDTLEKEIVIDNIVYEIKGLTRFESYKIKEKQASITNTTKTQTGDFKDAFLSLPQTQFYDKDLFRGNLSIQAQTLNIQDGEKEHSSKTDTHSITYPGLASADSALIPKEVPVNGKTYYLSGINWKTDNDTVDYNDQPKESGYTAVATYSRNYTKTNILDYVVSATYSGEVYALIPNETIYELKYEKKTQLAPKVQKPDMVSQMINDIQSGNFNLNTMAPLIIGGLLAITILVIFVLKQSTDTHGSDLIKNSKPKKDDKGEK